MVSDGGVVPGAAARARVTVMYRGAAGSHQPAHMVFSCSPALAGAGHHRDSGRYDYYSWGGGGGVLCVFRLYR